MSEQPFDLVTFPRNGLTDQFASFTFSKCISKRCLTCTKFIVNKKFISNVNKKSILLLITLDKTFHITLVT